MSSRREEEVLDGLERVFLARGLTDVTVASLAAELRCSRRLLYALAPTKDALFVRVIERFFARVRAEGDRAAARPGGLQRRMRAYLQPGIEGAMRLGDAFQADIANHAAGREVYDAHQRRRVIGLQALIQEGIDAGTLRGINPRIAAEMMLLIVRRVREPEFQRETGLSFARGLADAYALLRRGLVLQEGASRLAGASDPSDGDSRLNASDAA